MSRRNTMLAMLAVLLVAHSVAADDLFPTYRDDFEEQERLGVISLTGTTANYTINLTGIILLGLSLAAAVTLWAYLLTLFDKKAGGYGGGYGGGDSYGGSGGSSYKRSVDDPMATLPIVLSNMHERFQEAAVEDMPCRQRIVCETSLHKNSYPFNTFGHAINTFFSLVEQDKALVEQVEADKRAKLYYAAWKEGKRGKSCKATYEKCSLPMSRINSLLQTN